MSSCITEKFNGFTIIRSEYAKKVRREFSPIDIIYKPSKNIEIEPLCYYSSDITLAYSATYPRKNREMQQGRAFKVQSCHYCNKFFIHKDRRYQRHLKHCSGKPGII